MSTETQTENAGIVHLTEVGSRIEADGTERRLHLGYSAEGFHAAVGSKAGAPYEWGKPHPEAGAALNAAWNSGPGNVEDKKVAEIPDDVKAQADAAVAQTGAQKMTVQDMGETKGADAYDTKAMEAQRERQRQDALQEKTPEPAPTPAPTEQPDPDKA